MKRINSENFLSSMFRYLAISILFCFIGFFVGPFIIPPNVVYMANMIIGVVMIGLLIMCIFSRKSIIPRRFSMKWVYLYTFIQGILMYPILQYYIGDLGESVVINVFITVSILFALLSVYANKKPIGSFINFGSTLFACLIATLILTVLSVIFRSPIFVVIVSAISIIVFSIYILYDISLLKHEVYSGHIQDEKDLSIHVLNLYLDFINIFLDLLRMLSALKDTFED